MIYYCMLLKSLLLLTLSKPIAHNLSTFLVYSGLGTGAPAYTCAQSLAVCLNISGFCLYCRKNIIHKSTAQMGTARKHIKMVMMRS